MCMRWGSSGKLIWTRQQGEARRRLLLALAFLTLAPWCWSNGQQVLSDSERLLAFKAGIRTDPSGVLAGWQASASSPCTWPGVACNTDSRVVNVTLGGRGLVGTIAAAFGGLPFLALLDLSRNSLTGAIPSSFQQAAGLKGLDLSHNSLSGPIPPELANCSALASLDVSGNGVLGGALPSSLARLQDLTSFKAAGNNISGTIPSDYAMLHNLSVLDLSSNALQGGVLHLDWANLTKLTYLSLSNNLLDGSITQLPQLFGNHHRLRHLLLNHNAFTGQVSGNLSSVWRRMLSLDLSENSLSGGIPESLFMLKELVRLNLGKNNISATIPDSLGNCTSLEFFNLSSNVLQGNIPPGIYSLINLTVLDLSHNQITGSITPPLIPNLFPNILQIDLSYNNLSGYLPDSLGSVLSKLITLVVSHNQFSGFVSTGPIDAGQVPALQIYDLSANQFTGPVPESLGILRRLQYLSLFQNQFTGSIPAALGNCTALIWLDLQQNHLDGPLPDTLSSLSSLRVFSLSVNSLAGPIPAWVADFQDLQILNLGGNRFEGQIPQNLSGLTGFRQGSTADLNKTISAVEIPIVVKGTERIYTYVLQTTTVFDVSDNLLGGEIPQDVGTLGGLKYFNVSHNQLQGSIPSSLANLPLLESMDLSNNRLSGVIPLAFSDLYSLSTFDVSNNNLSGPIPTGTQFQSFNGSSFGGNPGLCGSPLSPCRTQTQGNAPPQLQDVGGGGEFMSIPGFIIGSVFAFAVTMNILYFTNYIRGPSPDPDEEPRSYYRRYGFFKG